jgi:hypothetical protein
MELQHAAPQVIERVNTYFGFPAVRQLRLLQMALRVAAPPAPPRRRDLRPDEETALGAAVGAVDDPDLRAALLQLGRAVRGG